MVFRGQILVSCWVVAGENASPELRPRKSSQNEGPLVMRLGIFGGSFDPVHYGHLLLVESCREQAGLDEVWLMPAAVSPHKRDGSTAPAKDRVEMLRLAVAGHPAINVSTLEIERGGVSYTVDTLRAIHAERPTDELFLLMGADTLADLPKWREPGEILRLALPVAVERHGSPPPDYAAIAGHVTPSRLHAIREQRVDMPVIELSATDIRERVRAGCSIRYRTPRAVEMYIQTQGLYR
jgi:nicotinate-nucleotide adenylyltransferase